LLGVLGAARFRIEYRTVASTPPNAWEEDQRADCAVVVTGSPGRVREGVDLLYRGSVKKLIISGVHPQAGWREILPTAPFYGGLRDEDIVLERRSTTTYGNATQTLPLVEALHCRSLILVTSTLHMHRALKTFQAVFPPDFPILPQAIVSGSLIPDGMDAFAEAVKSLFYSIWAY